MYRLTLFVSLISVHLPQNNLTFQFAQLNFLDSTYYLVALVLIISITAILIQGTWITAETPKRFNTVVLWFTWSNINITFRMIPLKSKSHHIPLPKMPPWLPTCETGTQNLSQTYHITYFTTDREAESLQHCFIYH